MRILLLEDSQRLQDLLSESLRRSGYKLDVIGTLAEFSVAVRSVSHDLLIVDLSLPDGDALSAIKELRSEGNTTPILIISARGTVEDRISGLDAGADDYLIKPFNHDELLARCRAVLRRPAELSGPSIAVGNTRLDLASGEVRVSDRLVELQPSQVRLLTILMRRAGVLYSKHALETSLSEFGREITSNAIEAVISRTRRSLHDAGSDISIQTVRGVGYALRTL